VLRRGGCAARLRPSEGPVSAPARAIPYPTTGRQTRSEAKVKFLLGLGPRPEGIPIHERCGLGAARTLDAYWRWAGIDPANRNETGSDARFCNRA